jgi:hypothetical protein
MQKKINFKPVSLKKFLGYGSARSCANGLAVILKKKLEDYAGKVIDRREK